jgi:CheY-like chemotaxis protein
MEFDSVELVFSIPRMEREPTRTTQVQIPLLVTGDDPALLQSLSHMLTLRLGAVQVDTAHSAYKAIEQVQARVYDAIISDIKMPRNSWPAQRPCRASCAKKARRWL